MVLKSRLPPVDWQPGDDPDHWAKCSKFPLPKNHDVNPDTDPFFYDEEEAAHLCNGTYDGQICPFRRKCLHRALVNNEQAGTFGGFTIEQRRWIRRNRDLIPRDTWEESNGWRWIVPSPEQLVELLEEDDADEESA